MKRIILFLLLVFVLISVTGNNAFAKDRVPPPAAVALLACAPGAATTTPNPFTVIAFSSVNVPATVPVAAVGDDCAVSLANLLNAGLKIKDVEALGTNIVYTLVKGYFD